MTSWNCAILPFPQALPPAPGAPIGAHQSHKQEQGIQILHQNSGNLSADNAEIVPKSQNILGWKGP